MCAGGCAQGLGDVHRGWGTLTGAEGHTHGLVDAHSGCCAPPPAPVRVPQRLCAYPNPCALPTAAVLAPAPCTGAGGRAQGLGDVHMGWEMCTWTGGRTQGLGDAHGGWGARTGAGGRAQGLGDPYLHCEKAMWYWAAHGRVQRPTSGYMARFDLKILSNDHPLVA